MSQSGYTNATPYLRGSWNWGAPGDMMTDPDGDGIHSVTVDLPLGNFEYKYAVDGFAGKQNMHGMSQNEFSWTTWHLEDRYHPTNWITLEACRSIKRRDPTRPGFWFVSYNHPHPPLVPLKQYFDRYKNTQITAPNIGSWALKKDRPYPIKLIQKTWDQLSDKKLEDTRRAFYALCTHIDHQIRTIIGTLREEKILDETIIVLAS